MTARTQRGEGDGVPDDVAVPARSGYTRSESRSPEYWTHVRKVVDQAPPLSEEKKRFIAAWFAQARVGKRLKENPLEEQ